MNYEIIKDVVSSFVPVTLDEKKVNTMNQSELLNITTRLFDGAPSYARARQLMDTGVLLYRSKDGHYTMAIYAEETGFYFVNMQVNNAKRVRFTTHEELLNLIVDIKE